MLFVARLKVVRRRASGLASRGLESEMEEGLIRWRGDVRVVFNCVGVEFGLMTYGTYSQRDEQLDRISKYISWI